MSETLTLPSQRTAVPLDWQPVDPTCLGIVRGVENAGFPGVILMGGALRDRYMGNQVNDYDLWASTDAFTLHPGDVEGAKQAIYERIAAIPGTGNIEVVESESELNNHLIKMRFNLHGLPVELMLGDEATTASGMAVRRNSTPICAIAMDSSGTVFAHPLFQEHAAKRIFAPENPGPSDHERFVRLSKKIPGLSYQGTNPEIQLSGMKLTGNSESVSSDPWTERVVSNRQATPIQPDTKSHKNTLLAFAKVTATLVGVAAIAGIGDALFFEGKGARKVFHR